MKITIRTNPEIVIDADSITENKKIEPTIVVPEARVAPVVSPQPEGKIKKRGKSVRHCKKCGEAGHRSDYCPQNGGGTMKDRIRSLADEGLSSEEIAAKLGCVLNRR